MFKLDDAWKKVILEALKKSGVVTDTTKDISFSIIIGVKNNGINFFEIKQKIK